MTLFQLVSLAISAIFVQNFVFAYTLGVDSFLAASSKRDTALCMGLAVTFMMGLACVLAYPITTFLLQPLGVEYMRTPVYFLMIAVLARLVEWLLKRMIPVLYETLGLYLPVVITNCAVLGVVLLNTQNKFGFAESAVYGVCSGLGFTLAIVLFASLRERLEFVECPEAFQGIPIALVAAGLLAMACMGFSGLQIG